MIVGENRGIIEQNIENIPDRIGYSSRMSLGLDQALVLFAINSLLNGNENNHVVYLSDGELSTSEMQNTIAKADELKGYGVTIWGVEYSNQSSNIASPGCLVTINDPKDYVNSFTSIIFRIET